MDKRTRLAHKMITEANRDGFRSFEAASGGSNWEAMHNMLVAQGVPSAVATDVIRKRMDNPFGNGGQGAQGYTRTQTTGNPSEVAAQLTVNVERETADIAESLPYVIFGAIDANNGYRRILQGLLPAGVTLTSVEIGEGDGEPEAALFTYDDGVNTDTIRVTCGAAPYPMVLASTLTDTMAIDRDRQSLSDSSKTAQFLTDLQVVVNNMWGTKTTRSLNPQSFKSPEQFQNGILDINVGINVDKETMLVGTMIDEAGFILSNNLFVRNFSAVRA